MFAAATGPLGDGAVYRIAPEQVGRAVPVVERKIHGLDFANGIAFDAVRSRLYVAELVASRILGFDVDPATGGLSNRTVVAEVTTPDNLELDEAGNLWVASPVGNEVLVVDPDSGAVRSVFQPTPGESSALTAEWRLRMQVGEPTLDLLGPPMWGPMPGLLTGIILTPDNGPVYVSGLGNALVKLDR
jgi:DNA-binding beta-propeller fold protein YncE